MAFDLRAVAYDAKTDYYVRKDALLKLIPEAEKNLRKRVSALLLEPHYNTKVILTVLYEGYPECPCCGKPIKIAGTGSMNGRFINYCGAKTCRSQYMSKHTDYAKENNKKGAADLRDALAAFGYKILKEHPTRALFKVECTKCGKVTNKSAAIGCYCSRVDPRCVEAERKTTRKEWVALEAALSAVDRTIVEKKHNSVVIGCLHCDKVLKERKVSYCNNPKLCKCQNQVSSKAQFAADHAKRAKAKKIKVVGTYIDSTTKLVHECKVCGHEWETRPDRLIKHGCPNCARAEAAPRAAATLKRNCLKRYGVVNHSQRPEVHEKAMRSRYKFKTLRVGGKSFSVQGYEGMALRVLVKEGYSVDDIQGHKGAKSVPYRYEGVSRQYFPDFQIGNTIIEVKSTYTYIADLEKNKAKVRACKRLGHDFRFMVITDKGELLSDKERIALEKNHG